MINNNWIFDNNYKLNVSAKLLTTKNLLSALKTFSIGLLLSITLMACEGEKTTHLVLLKGNKAAFYEGKLDKDFFEKNEILMAIENISPKSDVKVSKDLNQLSTFKLDGEDNMDDDVQAFISGCGYVNCNFTDIDGNNVARRVFCCNKNMNRCCPIAKKLYRRAQRRIRH